MNKEIYQFADFRLDVEQKLLQRNGESVSLQPKVFDILVLFLRKKGELVSREEMMNAVWADTFVEESNLRFCIHSLRKALGKGFVETVPKSGYRFTVEIKEVSEEILSDKPNEDVTKEQTPSPQKKTEKSLSTKRVWIFGILAFVLVGFFIIIAFSLSRENKPSHQNALGIQTLAVLPFASIGEKNTDLQTGLADSLITNLGKIKGLNVLPIGSTRQFIGKNIESVKVGRKLGVDTVLDGSYRFEGEKVRVTARLLRVADNEIIWTETFEAETTSNLNLESFISLRTARLLSLKIADARDEEFVDKKKNINPEALQNYLSARRIWRRNELYRRKEMIGLFEKTIELEPNWALAYSGYAEALVTSDEFDVDWKKVEQIAKKASELDFNLAEPHAIFGEMYQWRDWNWNEAEKEYKASNGINDNNALTHYKYARLLMIRRRFAEAKEELDKAIEIEPFSPLHYSGLCELYSYEQKFDQSLAACNYAKQIEPDFWQIPKLLYWVYVQRKMHAELSELVLSKLSDTEKESHPMTKAIAKNDLRPFWQRSIDERLTRTQARRRPITLAMMYLQIGEKEKALDYIEKAFDQRDFNLPMVNADSNFDPIRKDQRFIDVMKKIGL